ncbi:Glutamate-1-semialdehyde 2,1-aminomutase [compost metagenome]
MLETGLNDILSKYNKPFYVARQGSAFCVYFMDHAPKDFHDIALNNDAAFDKEYRHKLIENGIFNFPLPSKQGSISYAHSVADIEETLEKNEQVLSALFKR